jgi:hypothetical protein
MSLTTLSRKQNESVSQTSSRTVAIAVAKIDFISSEYQPRIDDFMLSNISYHIIGIEKEETVSDRILVVRKEARVLHGKIMRCNVLEVSVNAESIAVARLKLYGHE